MNRARTLAAAMMLAGAACLLGGCGMQDAMLGAQGGLLFQGYDTLALPGEQVALTVSLQGGDYLQGVEGYLVGYYLIDHKIGESRTDDDGVAEIPFTAESAGNQVIVARLEDPDARKLAIEGIEILVAARTPEAPMAVVDLDHTLVASDFEQVLAGTAEPMADSERVMHRIAESRTVIYLTHRPEIFISKTKRWLRKYDYPLGPLLTSTLSEFFSGSGRFKSTKIHELKREFRNIQVGIGDKPSDAAAYAANGLRAILIIQPGGMKTPLALRKAMVEIEQLPDGVEVVDSWKQVEQALFEGKHFSPREAAERLRRLADEREKEILKSLALPEAEAGKGSGT